MIRILAGTLVITGVILGRFVSAWWLIVPLFAGANLIQSAITGFCPAEIIFRKLGVKDRCGETAEAQARN